MENRQLSDDARKNEINIALNPLNNQNDKKEGTIGSLMKKYKCSWDGYYKLDLNKNYDDTSKLNLKNLKDFLGYLTYEINKKYLDYCDIKNEKTYFPIVIPEHFINNYYVEIKESVTEKYLLSIINWYVEKYIDENKNVYTNCYSKLIENEYIDLLNSKGLSDMYELIPDYSKHEQIKFKDITYEIKHELKDIKKRIEIAEKIISTLMPTKYRKNPNIVIFDKEKEEHKKIGETGYYNWPKSTIFIPQDAEVSWIIHEYLHSMMDEKMDSDGKSSNKIMIFECDLLFDMTKGQKVLKYDNEGKKSFKYVNVSGIEEYGGCVKGIGKRLPVKSYQNGELFAYVFQYIHQVEDSRYIDEMGEISSKKIRENFAYKLNELARLNFTLAAAMLAISRGKI